MTKTATTEIWTSGITNIPKNDRNSRYTFFELDTKDIDKLHFVLEVYRNYLGSCYVHELISGYHFFNFKPISKNSYYEVIKKIKHLNPLCPLTVLRIIPNKWMGEERYWRKGAIIGKDNDNELLWFKSMIDSGYTMAISHKYEVVNYPFEECPTCGICNTIMWNYELGYFICVKCNLQTIGRKLRKCYQW